MKCLVLAGGKGNSLWPLSRENYPKQFMEIRDGRSLIQETVARNMPFCEEFIISTNESYHFIVEGQMKVFQGLKYRCFLEEESKKTAPAIAMVCMACNPSELIFVVSSDQIIQGENYKEAIVQAQKMAREGHLVTFGMDITGPHTGYGYIRHDGEKVLEFKEKPDIETARKYIEDGDYLWNSGNFLFRAGDFLEELKKHSPDVYESCKKCVSHLDMGRKDVHMIRFLTKDIPAVGIEHAVFEKSKNVCVIASGFQWFDVGDLEQLSKGVLGDESPNTIVEDCKNTTIINTVPSRLIVANDLENVIVVNTEDAMYISQKGATDGIKDIMKKNHKAYASYFENHTILYRKWGTYETILAANDYRVRRINVYPGKVHHLHQHDRRSEQWTIVEGTATVTMGLETREYNVKESVYIPAGVSHSVENRTQESVVIMEISLGQNVTDEDTVRIQNEKDGMMYSDPIVKLEPAFKDYLWGGTKLKDIYHKKCDYDIVAESWELSAHKAGQSVIAGGKHQGMLFGEYLEQVGTDVLGWKCEAFERFPILIKFIDAKNSLSIQVHPDDDYALREENEYGKNEMWYIMDCEEGASIYYGVKHDMTKAELQERINNNTILEVLNRVPVHKGETYFIEAGTIHAIGAGILICEIQQSSNCTYRIYDYDRKDQFGNKRELHIDKAREVCCLQTKAVTDAMMPIDSEEETARGYEKQVLGSCKYFESTRYEVLTEAVIDIDDASFCSIIIIEGSGKIRYKGDSQRFVAADSFFIPAGRKKIIISGKCVFIKTRI